MRSIPSLLAVALFVLPACGDDPKPEPTPAARTGELKVEISSESDDVASLCYDIRVTDGTNAVINDTKRACADVGTDYAATFACSAEPGVLTHTVTVDVVAGFLKDGTAPTADPDGPGDLSEIVNPCPNGCTLTVLCTKDEVKRAGFDFNVVKTFRQGFLDVVVTTTVAPETLPADIPEVLCYDLTVTNSAGDELSSKGLCDDAFGSGGDFLYIMACDAGRGQDAATLKVALTGVFTEARGEGDPAGPGVRGDYNFACDDNCTFAVTCDENADTAVSVAATVSRIYPAGVATVDVATTVTGDDAEPVTGGCYGITVTNSQDQELVNQTALCSAFHMATDGNPADLAYTAPCDSTPWPEGGTTHTVSLVVESLYGAAGAPSASGLPPSATIEGLTNPCPAEAPCTTTFACDADVEASAAFTLGFEALPVE